MAAVEYGTVAVVPKGEWSITTQYDVGNLVSYDGSSYVAKNLPPLGTLPTDFNYWQVSAQGAGRATANTLGTVKPDGTTTEVSQEGALSAKIATQTTPGIVKGSSGITVGNDGAVDVNTTFEQATELANIIAGEAIASVLGKVSKTIATTMNLDQNALLKNMMTSINVNDSNKIPTAALTYAMQQAITQNAEAITQLNGDLGSFKLIEKYNAGASILTLTTQKSLIPDDAAYMIIVKWPLNSTQANPPFIILLYTRANSIFYQIIGARNPVTNIQFTNDFRLTVDFSLAIWPVLVIFRVA